MSDIPVQQSLGIVFLGSFNPRIFHPSWFENEGLARPDELAESLSERQQNILVTPDVARCDIGPDISVECLQHRLTINSATSLGEERLRNLASDILSKLPHTPITAIGLNHSLVYESKTEQDWHDIGDMLVPKERIWNEVMEQRPGMAIVRIEECRSGPVPVRIWVTIEPIREIHPPYRFQIHTNWHGDLKNDPPEAAGGAKLASDFIDSQWETALRMGPKLAKKLFQEVRERRP